MQGDKAIIRMLNAVLTNELTSVNQYFLHARMFENWGFKRLGEIIYEESIGEMKHADKLIKRILFLEGLPNLQDLHKLAIGETVGEGLTADLALEIAGRATLVEGIKLCESGADYVTRNMLREIINAEYHIKNIYRVQEVILTQNWTEYARLDAEEQQDFIESVADDLSVDVLTPGSKDKDKLSSIFVDIEYLDTDGKRAEKFLTALTARWIDDVVQRDFNQLKLERETKLLLGFCPFAV